MHTPTPLWRRCRYPIIRKEMNPQGHFGKAPGRGLLHSDRHGGNPDQYFHVEKHSVFIVLMQKLCLLTQWNQVEWRVQSSSEAVGPAVAAGGFGTGRKGVWVPVLLPPGYVTLASHLRFVNVSFFPCKMGLMILIPIRDVSNVFHTTKQTILQHQMGVLWSSQFWHCLPGDNVKCQRLRAQPHKTAPHPLHSLQMTITNPGFHLCFWSDIVGSQTDMSRVGRKGRDWRSPGRKAQVPSNCKVGPCPQHDLSSPSILLGMQFRPPDLSYCW